MSVFPNLALFKTFDVELGGSFGIRHLRPAWVRCGRQTGRVLSFLDLRPHCMLMGSCGLMVVPGQGWTAEKARLWGAGRAGAEAKADGNDLPNAEWVERMSRHHADLVFISQSK